MRRTQRERKPRRRTPRTEAGHQPTPLPIATLHDGTGAADELLARIDALLAEHSA